MNEDESKIYERAEQLVESHALFMRELVTLRKERNLSLELVGTRMGISPSAVALFEDHDSNPTLSSIRRYALAVGAKIEHTVIDDLAITASVG
jgi:transcriptional regulator with XRE-family HTH domain